MKFQTFAATAAMVLAGVGASVATAGAATIDLALVLGNSGFEVGNTSQWTVTRPNTDSGYQTSTNANFGVDRVIAPLNPLFSNGTKLPTLTAPDGNDFIGVLNLGDNDRKGKLQHLAVPVNYLAGDIFEVTVWANRGRLASSTNPFNNSTFSTTLSDPELSLQFMAWGTIPGATPTVNSNDNWTRSPVITTKAFTLWGDPGQWTSQTFSFTTAVNLSYISLAIAGQNNNHDQYVAFDIDPKDPVVAPVPEPASIFLLGLGLLGMAGVARKRLKK